MNCPKCSATMEKVQYESIEVDRCTDCKGIWFDMLEYEHRKAIEGSEEIDVGDPEVGKQTNLVDQIACPVWAISTIPTGTGSQPSWVSIYFSRLSLTSVS